MRWDADRQRLRCSPTDLANFLGCQHRTRLDVRGARGELAIPRWVDPLADTLRQRGLDHERRYLETLRQDGRVIEDLTDVPSELGACRLAEAMSAGADVIVQAPLGGDGWFGYADVLRRVEGHSALGSWHYEALDTKLSRDTKGGTILQLCVYSELLTALQGRVPDSFSVVTPIAAERYRFDEYAAFYRFVKARFLAFVLEASAHTYPEPVSHCDVCRWDQGCRARRRADDHLSYVAGLGRLQQTELEGRDIATLAALAGIPVPLDFRPRRGGRETYERLREQARLQEVQRTTRVPTFELLPVGLRPVDPARPEVAQREGLLRLPEPSPGDLFLDLEGDPFAREGGREYLFGLSAAGESAGSPSTYACWWATDDAEERAAFEQVVDRIMSALATDPGMHVYHYAPYEPAAFKRLSGRHATRGEEVDTLLRGGRFVDLYAIVKQALRAGVESYSIKSLEPFYGFARDVDLRHAGDQRRVVEVALELGDLATLTRAVKAAVEGYNRDDCRSTAALRDWLERLRAGHIEAGVDVSRPPLVPGDPNPEVNERDRMAAQLRDQLLARTPASADEQTALHLLAYMVDWHRREERVAWGEYHRLREQSDEDLLDEPAALAGMTFVARVFEPVGRKTSPIDRYRFPFQESGIGAGDTVKLKDDSSFGTVEAIDKQGLTIDIKKPKDRAGVHPDVVIAHTIVSSRAQEDSIRRIALAIVDRGLEGPGGDRLVSALLRGLPPRLVAGRFDDVAQPDVVTDAADRAVRLVTDLDESVLAIQGPPGAGKTFTGARMIAALVARGRKVGVVATGHKVIRKLMVDAMAEARRQGTTMPGAHKPGEDALPVPDGMTIEQPGGNEQARAWLGEAGGRVLGGTAWLWARPEFEKSVDVLFVDEAGQMSLANVLAVTPAARNLVLLGDPQQLEQPKKGSHPDGVDVSALEHLLGGHATMPDDRGIFLPVTWRLSPEVCAFTSEVFYEGKLRSRVAAGTRRLVASAPLAPSRFEGAGLRVIETLHDGCRNASDEEVSVVVDVVAELVGGGLAYRDADGPDQRLALDDVLVVAPYNAQVARLRDTLAARFGAGARVGTVDKFQGQEAPVVVYSMTSSRPEDAPRGMEFLYSLNRLNVATSRAKALCILVANPHLFAPECRTPRQMQLASALCRYREMAIVIR